MEWNRLLCDKRHGHTRAKTSQDLRTEFQRDYHRIIGSASFRRLQDKTQVFPLDRSDFVRTRLTHSLEVSSFAKSLGQSVFTYIMENGLDPTVDNSVKDAACSILECAGLLHDIGNPPFGHFGEEVIRGWFRENLPKIQLDGVPAEKLLTEQMRADLYNFEGNAQALRLLTKLHYLVDENGMHLTYALLNTIVKYPVSSLGINKKSGNIKDKKMGFYYAEEELFRGICRETGTEGCRHPLTFLLEAADDIAYKTADIEDAVKKGCITYSTLRRELRKRLSLCSDEEEKARYRQVTGWLSEKYRRAVQRNIPDPGTNAVQNWIVSVQGFLINCAVYAFTKNYKAIMNGEFKGELLAASHGKTLADALSRIAYEYAFLSKPIVRLEISADTMMSFLLDRFVKAAVDYDTGKKLSAVNEKLMDIVSENYKQIYSIYSEGRSEGEKLYLRLLLVTDCICGMTDSYARSLYREMNGID